MSASQAELQQRAPAALAIEHGLALAPHDRGFRRFTQLRVLDPLD